MKVVKEYKTLDKSEWGDGEWQQEPDKIQYFDEKTGYDCLAVRGPHGGWCGYVGIPSTHPAYRKDYDSIDNVEVHGGLTFADLCHPGDESHSICHIPLPGREDHIWWLGFDCAHAGDYSPAYSSIWKTIGHEPLSRRNKWDTYKDIKYVEKEIRDLADQLKAIE